MPQVLIRKIIFVCILSALAQPAILAQTITFHYLPSELPPIDDDRYGERVGAGDFDGDGREDMVIATPFKTVEGVVAAGAVVVSYGSGALGQQVLLPDDSGHPLEQASNYGFAIVAMDLLGDSSDELIVGVPGASTGGITTGAIDIWIGGPSGLSFGVRWFPNDATPQVGARFGTALAAAGGALFIGAPYALSSELVDGIAAGAVYHGTYDPVQGFCLTGRLEQDSPYIPGASETGDEWGASVAAIFLDSGLYRLAVGAPREDIGSTSNTGAAWDLVVQTTPSCASGTPAPMVVASVIHYQGNGTIPGVPEENDLFGTSVVYGQFDGRGTPDLAIGVPREDREADGLGDTGCVHIIGEVGTLACRFVDLLSELDAASGQEAGFSLAAADWNVDGLDDLLIGVPGEDGEFGRQGAAIVANGTADGPLPERIFKFNGINGSFYRFGQSVGFIETREIGLTQLDFLIGQPGWDDHLDDVNRAGRVTRTFVPISMLFGDDFETGDLSAWSR